MINLKNKKILITAASGGIGNALVKKFVSLGGNVIGSGTKSEKLDSLKKQYPSIKVKKFDISEHSRIEEFIEDVALELGGIDIFINNAGIAVFGPPLEITEEDWKKCFSVDLDAVWYCSRAVLPHMLYCSKGSIVNIASVAGKDGNANASAYSSAKAGVIGRT